MSLQITPQVVSLAKAGSTALNGAVTLTGGTNITLTQSGQDISIAAASASMAIGGTISSGTTGSILFVGAGPVLSQNNSNLFWDDSNIRLGVGTTSPGAKIESMCASATDLGLIVQGAASQSGDLAEFMDSSGNIHTSINQYGNIVLSTTNQTYTTSASAILNNLTSTVTLDFANATMQCFQFNPTVVLEQGGNLFGTFLGFSVIPTIKNAAGEANAIGLCQMIKLGPTFTADGATITHFGNTNVLSQFSLSRVNSGTITVSSHTDFQATGGTGIGAGCTLSSRVALGIGDLTNAGTFTSQIGVDIGSLVNATTNIALRTGVGGDIQFGNKITKYNNIATVSGGVPSELATVDLTAQAAAIAATTIYTPAATGLFRVSIYLQVTRAATTSSVLGGATGVIITYNDGDGNVAQSNTAALATTAGAIAVTAAGNTTATNLEGTMVIYARTGVAIKYAIDYTSVGVTTMQFAAHLKVEAL